MESNRHRATQSTNTATAFTEIHKHSFLGGTHRAHPSLSQGALGAADTLNPRMTAL